MIFEQITDKTEKEVISRQILEALPEWFGIPKAREEYISDSREQIMLAAKENGKSLGFICLKETGIATVELAVMGVLKEFHRQGIGKGLFNSAKEISVQNGYCFMQVKTVQMGRYKEYDETNLFYISLGFKEFEVFPTLWDECNPCQIYVMSLK